MNTQTQEIKSKTQKAACQPVIIRNMSDAGMVSGWAIEINITEINGIPVSAVMTDETGRIGLGEWVWKNRKVVNDYLRTII